MVTIANRELKMSSFYYALLMSLILVGGIIAHIDTDKIVVLVSCACFLAMSEPVIFECVSFLFPLAAAINAPHVWLIVLLICIIKRKKIGIWALVLCVSVLLLELIAHFVYGISDSNRMLGYIATIGLFIYMMDETVTDIDYASCIRRYIAGVCTIFFIYCLDAYSTEGIKFLTAILGGNIRFGGTAATDLFANMSIGLNANTLAYYSVSAIACIFTMIEFQKRFLEEGQLFYLLIALSWCVLIGAITISRTWLLAVCVCLLLYLFSRNKKPLAFIKRFLIITIIASISFYFVYSKTAIFDSFLSRFETASMTTANGRTTITSDYLSAFFQSDVFMLLGTGVTDYNQVINQYMSVHAGAIQILVCLGFPGASLLLAYLCRPICKAIKKRVGLIWWLPIIIIVLFTQTIQFLNPYMLMLPYTIGVYALRLGKIIGGEEKLK